MVKEGEQKANFRLPHEKVLVKPIIRQGQWLPKDHSGSFMYDNTRLVLQAPISQDTGRIKNPLTREEQEFFESNESGLDFARGDLSPSKKKDNFWEEHQVHVRKPDAIVTDETILMVLDLSDPMQYLEYKILMANTSVGGGVVAPSWELREASGEYKIALVREKEKDKEKVTKANKKVQAYKQLGKIDSSSEKLYNTLYVYYLSSTSDTSKKPSKDSSKEFYIAELGNIIEKDVEGFLAVIEDKDNFDYKLLVMQALEKGEINYSRARGFETDDKIPMGRTLSQAVGFLKDPKNQEDYLRLKNLVGE